MTQLSPVGFVGSPGQAPVSFVGSFQNAFRLTDSPLGSGGLSDITDANAAADAILETAINGTAVGITAFAAEPGETVTYTLTDDAGGRFAIADPNTGVVTKAGALDAETTGSHNITVLATSTSGMTKDRSFSITVLDDTGEFAVGAVTDSDAGANDVLESAANGATVGITAFASDADVTDTITYSLTDDAGGRFAIDTDTGVVTVADTGLIDFETATSHQITVRADSTDGSFNTQNFTITVLNDAVDDGLVSAARFDGTSDSLSRAVATGAADNGNALGGLPVKFMGSDGVVQYIWSNSTGSYVRKNADNRIEVFMANAVGVEVFRIVSTNGFTVASGWLLIEFTKDKLYVNNADETGTRTTGAGGTIDWTSEWYWGRDSAGGNRLNAEAARLYLTNEDIDIALNRNLFASSFAPLTLADIKTDGSGPTGTQALDFLPNGFTAFSQNAGGAGNYTLAGALTVGEGPAGAALTAPVAAAAFPVVEATATFNKSGTGSGADYTLPTGITSADLLILIVSGVINSTTPMGWTQIASLGGSSGPPRTRIYVRDADGLEGSTVALDATLRAVSVAYRISGARGAAFVEVTTQGSVSADASPNPPNEAISFGPADTLWIAGAAIRSTDYTIDGIPTNYTDEISIIGTGSTDSQNGIATARRELSTAVEDPGPFTLNQAEDWAAFTIAVAAPSTGPTAVTRYVNTVSLPGGDGTTNDTVGANRAYASLQEWATAEAKDLVAADETHTVLCAGATADIEANTGLWTTSETNFLKIAANDGDAAGLYQGTLTISKSHYRIDASGLKDALTIGGLGENGFLILSGIQFDETGGTGFYQLKGANIGNNARIVGEYCRFHARFHSLGEWPWGIHPTTEPVVAEFHHCMFKGLRKKFVLESGMAGELETIYLFNCGMAEGQWEALDERSGAIHAYNCYAFEHGGDFHACTTVDHCASDSGFVGDANHVDISPEPVEADGWSATFITATGTVYDLRLRDEGGGTNRLLNAGNNANYPAASGLKFVQRATDVTGAAVSLATPSIGPVEDI